MPNQQSRVGKNHDLKKELKNQNQIFYLNQIFYFFLNSYFTNFFTKKTIDLNRN